MFSILTQTLRLVAARWPVLLAWYLAGWLVRYLVIEVASTAGAYSALAGLMILPLATLARLASFIGMFLALRDVMPSFADMKRRGVDDIDRTTEGRTGPGRVYDIFLVSILPFFAFYAAWKFLGDDLGEYAQKALPKIDYFTRDDTTGAILDLRLEPLTIAVIVLAFAGRYLIKRNQEKLPKWTAILAVYFEAVWVYLTFFFISNYSNDFNDWLSNRAVMHWLADFRGWISSLFAPVGWVWDGVEWAIGEAGGLLLLPVAWLAIAGVVYGRALAAQKIAYRPRNRYYESARSRVSALPKGVVRRAADVGNDFLERWRPLANAFVLMWRAGVVPLGLYVLAYTVLEAGTTWAFMGVIQVVGPHNLDTWWMNLDSIYSFGIDAIIEPLRICLIAAGYDYCLRKLEERREVAAATGTEPEPSPAATA
ncbi:hypothetical protein HD599_003370 [Conyzicola lurida]|uniref:Transmembrane protein n=1 Tax=Conyzicola lurida TaxID=1172621 RepID=A0A841APC4_9MICO|nr:hypothetical protein [Conyzicola lurida]MBB5845047.1 hypothetical protein [Conyzicola lurida]